MLWKNTFVQALRIDGFIIIYNNYNIFKNIHDCLNCTYYTLLHRKASLQTFESLKIQKCLRNWIIFAIHFSCLPTSNTTSTLSADLNELLLRFCTHQAAIHIHLSIFFKKIRNIVNPLLLVFLMHGRKVF